MSIDQLARMLERRWKRTLFRSPERFAVIVARQALKETQSVQQTLYRMHSSARWARYRDPNSGDAEAITALIAGIERINTKKLATARSRRNPL